MTIAILGTVLIVIGACFFFIAGAFFWKAYRKFDQAALIFESTAAMNEVVAMQLRATTASVSGELAKASFNRSADNVDSIVRTAREAVKGIKG